MEVSVGQVDERIAFGSMAKGQKRYGSTSTRIKRDETQGFPYTVQLGDTLQGLAVKFGVSVSLSSLLLSSWFPERMLICI